jgi:hypothetical protein
MFCSHSGEPKAASLLDSSTLSCNRFERNHRNRASSNTHDNHASSQAYHAALAVLLLLTGAAVAQPRCSAGQDAGAARVQLPSGNANVTALKQFAWDGGSNIVEVCDLSGNPTSLAAWRFYSGEIDQRYPGICIGVSYGGGAMQYSCAAPRSVRIAFGSPNDTPQSVIRFNQWSNGLVAN